MSTPSTKAIAARVPYEVYVDLLDRAMTNKMSVNEFLIHQIERAKGQLLNDVDLSITRRELDKSKKEVADLAGQLAASRAAYSAKEKELQGVSAQAAKLNGEAVQAAVLRRAALIKDAELLTVTFNKDDEIRRLKQEVQAKAREILTLKTEVASGQANGKEIVRLTGLLHQKQQQVAELVKGLETYNDDTERLAREKEDLIKKYTADHERTIRRVEWLYRTLADLHDKAGFLKGMDERYWSVIEGFKNSFVQKKSELFSTKAPT